MKAQTFIDFYVSLTIFVIFAAYIFFQVADILPTHVNAINSQILHSEAYQMSELLVSDPGEPTNWETQLPQIQRIGLMDETKNETNLLSTAKISDISSICSNLPTLLGTSYHVSLTIIDRVTNSILAGCYPSSAPTPIILVNMTRIVAFSSGNYGTLNLQVW